MTLIDQLAEQRINEAIERGELEGLPGAGRRLDLDDDSMVPEELRAGFRLLKNAGYVPAGLELRKEIVSLESLIVQARCQEERDSLSKRLRYLLLQLSIASPDAPIVSEQRYLDKLRDKC